MEASAVALFVCLSFRLSLFVWDERARFLGPSMVHGSYGNLLTRGCARYAGTSQLLMRPAVAVVVAPLTSTPYCETGKLHKRTAGTSFNNNI